jgi:hypothetical protein
MSWARIVLMTPAPHDQTPDARDGRRLGRWEGWTVDWRGNPIVEFDSEAHAEWCAKWAPACPVGNPQRVRRPLGFRERSIGELELRVDLGGNDGGVCQVILDERDDEVYVRVLVCYDDDDDAPQPDREYVDCPVRVWLEKPLGMRAVIDVGSDEELPLFIPAYLNNVPQPDHGYHPANRAIDDPRLVGMKP